MSHRHLRIKTPKPNLRFLLYLKLLPCSNLSECSDYHLVAQATNLSLTLTAHFVLVHKPSVTVPCQFYLLSNSQTPSRSLCVSVTDLWMHILGWCANDYTLLCRVISIISQNPCSETVIPFFMAALQEYILLGSHSHLLLNSTLQMNFKIPFEWFPYIYDCNYFLSACYTPAYLVSCKYLLYAFSHIEWLGMWVLELAYMASNGSSAIYKLCDLIQGIWPIVYSSVMCEDNNRTCLILMVVVRIKWVNASKVLRTLCDTS